MKSVIAVLLAVAAVVSAEHNHGHHHQHQHLHKRVDGTTTSVEVVPGPTVIAYILDGQPISAAEVQEGVANGTLKIESNGVLSQLSLSVPATTQSSSSTKSAKPTTTSSSSTSSSTSSAASTPSAASNVANVSPGSDDASFTSDWSTGLDTPFPSGQVSCSTFPDAYGAVPVPWLGLQGWTGVQNPGSILGGFSGILTMTSGQCSSGACCTEGSYCSYACPAGYQKSQWPETQGATGQSVGGLLCQNGMLQLTNPSLSNTLCIPSDSPVTVLVQNNIGQQVAICRTDYPGTESETVPLSVQPGATTNLTCPNADSYYTWQGAHTSAQYYVNPAGVSIQQGCQWGSPGNNWGNYAPLNLGVGYSAGAAWLSIFQNAPTTNAQLDFTVTITGDDMSGTCRYSNGQYCGGANYDDCSSTTGCTVSVASGTATFVFSN